MIARQLLEYSDPAPRWRTARNASAARRLRVRRQRYRSIGLWVRGLGLATAVVLLYLGLLANITRLNYEVSHAKQARARIALGILRNADVIARLESRENLEAMAARLGMREPETFVAIALPPPRRSAKAADGVAFLGGVTLSR
ncbi:MAG: hypothetical protein JO060_00605 [Candidatus Eremiobacteraeota bacterium]|nr:hypothetical protein [Candidatus Eremiobacteraeota bacterium]MBV9647095.1 hypothetical protein [Candidatus Eremiobacteraeota bacterium]